MSNFFQEHKKVLFYHPNDIELNTKIKDVGLSEAIIRFTGYLWNFLHREKWVIIQSLLYLQNFYI